MQDLSTRVHELLPSLTLDQLAVFMLEAEAGCAGVMDRKSFMDFMVCSTPFSVFPPERPKSAGQSFRRPSRASLDGSRPRTAGQAIGHTADTSSLFIETCRDSTVTHSVASTPDGRASREAARKR